ncbi:MAG: hypothetical protein HOC71_13785 [Candidatus Latescibacteria bacterium]|jgi:hypothetical protein|nr:hypothetical protein [Candidatus Latescibacterota bacterium]
MGKWIYVICFLLLTLNSIAVAENSIVSPKEQKEWLRHLIPLPHEISFKEKITINPKNVLITVRKNASETEKYAASELKALFKEKTGVAPSGKAFEIIIGVIDAHGKLEGALLKSAERLEILPHKEQAYSIQPVGKNKLLLGALNERGVYYAVRTLHQLLEPFITKNEVSIPLVEVIDWPDMDERGIWNFPNPKDWIPWLASVKLNYGKMITQLHNVERGKKNRATIDRELLMKGRLMAFNYVPVITHLNFLKRIGLYRAYPELSGVGDGALSGRYFAHKRGDNHRVPNASNPLLTAIITEWMMDIASQGANDLSCWLSERPAESGDDETSKAGQFVLEARAFVNAWRETRETYPDFNIRLFLSTTTSERYYKVLAETPPEVRIERCCSMTLERVTHIPRDLFRNPLFDKYASEGRWIASYDVPYTANGLVETPEFKVPQSSAHRIRDFARQLIERKYKGAYGMMAFGNLAREICGFNITALAEWSWNLNGRSEKEFAIAWATREGFENPEAVGEWSELIGPIEFDVYDSDFPVCYSWGKAVKMVDSRTRPYLGEGMFRYYASPEDFDSKIARCEKALKIAKTFKRTNLANETRVVMSYVRLAKYVYEVAEKVATSELSTLESQDILRDSLNNLELAGKENVTAIKEWRNALGPKPWHYRVHDAIKATETTVQDISQIVEGKYFY